MAYPSPKILLSLCIPLVLISCKSPVNTSKQVAALDGSIWAIFQDSKAHYWFGTNGKGVYHFDGTNLRPFTTADGLISNQIRGIQEDQVGNIFIETPAGISKFDGSSFTSLSPLIAKDYDWALQSTDLWFHCNGNAADVYRYDGSKLYQLKLPRIDLEKAFGIQPNDLSYSAYSVFGIDKDPQGNLWLGTVLAGAYRYDGESFLWIGERELSRQDDGREPGVRSILQDQDGNIWLSNLQSKYLIENAQYIKRPGIDRSGKASEEKPFFFNAGLSDENGHLWMTTYDSGLWKYDGNTLSHYDLKNKKEGLLLLSIYQDNDGVLWLGTDNDGVYQYDGETFEKFRWPL